MQKFPLVKCLIQTIFTLLPIESFSQLITKIESLQSLYIETYRDTTFLTSATGFIIKSKTQNYLVTNYHVVTNKNPVNGQWLDTSKKMLPNKILVVQNGKKLGQYIKKWEQLLDKNGGALWYGNSINNEMVDVIQLPLKDTSDISIFPVPYKSRFDSSIVFQPTDKVFILGFPLAMHSTPFMPIWKAGTIASEPAVDQENKPIIWVDASTFGGMSGSPVYYISNEFIDKFGNKTMFGKPTTVFLGVFSHRYHAFSALWKAEFLREIFDALP